MFDENGNWIPDPTVPDPYGKNIQLGTSAAAQDQGDPAEATAPEPAPTAQAVAPPAPSQNQKSLYERTGIKTYGPNASAGEAKQQDYMAGEAAAADATGQGRPQQYGAAEPDRSAEGPLSQSDAADAMMATNPKSRDPSRHVETPDEIRTRNAAYDDYVQQSRSNREADRQALDARATKNRAADREKDADMWAQFRDVNALQGGGGPMMHPGGQGPSMTNVGGALLLGPGFGSSPYGHRGFDPLAPEKVALREKINDRLTKGLDETARHHQASEVNLDAQNKIKSDSLEQRKTQFAAQMEKSTVKDADAMRHQLDQTIAQLRGRESQAKQAAGGTGGDYAKMLDAKMDPHTKKLVVAEPGSYQALAREAVMLGDKLDDFHQNKGYNFTIAGPDADYIDGLRMYLK